MWIFFSTFAVTTLPRQTARCVQLAITAQKTPPTSARACVPPDTTVLWVPLTSMSSPAPRDPTTQPLAVMVQKTVCPVPQGSTVKVSLISYRSWISKVCLVPQGSTVRVSHISYRSWISKDCLSCPPGQFCQSKSYFLQIMNF